MADAQALDVFSSERRRIVIQTLGSGDALGWSWLFPPYQWHLDAMAREPVAAIAFDGGCLRDKCHVDHELGHLLMEPHAGAPAATRLLLLDVYAWQPLSPASWHPARRGCWAGAARREGPSRSSSSPPVSEPWRHREDFGRVTLLYGARTPGDLPFQRELGRWRRRIDVLVTVDRASPGLDGRVGMAGSLLPRGVVDPALVCREGQVQSRSISRRR